MIEEGLNGRTTVFDDSVSVGRNGLPYFLPCLESHSPLDLVIIMLGTNDTKPIIAATPFDITAGMARLAKAALDPYTYTTEKPPKVLIAAPAPLGEASVHSPEEAVAREKSKALAPLYRDLAKNLGCGFIDAGAVASAAEGDVYKRQTQYRSHLLHKSVAVLNKLCTAYILYIGIFKFVF